MAQARAERWCDHRVQFVPIGRALLPYGSILGEHQEGDIVLLGAPSVKASRSASTCARRSPAFPGAAATAAVRRSIPYSPLRGCVPGLSHTIGVQHNCVSRPERNGCRRSIAVPRTRQGRSQFGGVTLCAPDARRTSGGSCPAFAYWRVCFAGSTTARKTVTNIIEEDCLRSVRLTSINTAAGLRCRSAAERMRLCTIAI